MRDRRAGELAGEFVPLLSAKLLPPTPGTFHLERPRLMNRLRAGLEKRATFVLAGPGYGKTSLLSGLTRELAGESAWYWLDPTDRDPWTFFHYLIHAIREQVPEFGERSSALWKDLRSRPFEVERLADIVMSDAEEALGGRCVIVLDEVHHLEGSPLATRVLRRLLAYLPGTLHLVLVGRSAPDLGLRSLVAEGSASLIEGEDLLFTLEETRTLLVETFGLRIRPETLEKVHSRTRGWVTALQLLRQTARLGSGDADLPETVFARTETEIFDYFSEEVLASESDEVREFLLDSSPPAFIDPDICSEVLANGRPLDVPSLLALLQKRRLFISPLESKGEYYAYDPLFLDFLRRKLKAERGPAGKRDLDRRYGRAFARRGAFTQALAHWIEAEDVGGVSELVARQGKALLHAGALDIVQQASRFLAERGVRSAIVEDLVGEACRLAGDYTAAVGHFEKALSGVSARGASAGDVASEREVPGGAAAAGPDSAGAAAGAASAAGASAGDASGGRAEAGGDELPPEARASTLLGLAYSLLKTGEPARAAEIAASALVETKGDDLSLVGRILNVLSIIHYRENRLQEAIDGWQDALARARQAGDEHLVLMIAHNLGLPHAARGDFQRASECFRILTGPDNPRLGPDEGAAYLNLARIATIEGDHAKARELLGDAKEIARKWRLSALSADVLEAEGTLLREAGDLDAARERYTKARALFTELGQTGLLANLDEEEAVLASRGGRHAEAERMASEVALRMRESGNEEGLASSLLALGEIRARGGDAKGAVAPLSESAGLFERLDRSYQQCQARLWLALVLHFAGDAAGARSESEAALKIAARFGYARAVGRIAAIDAGFGRLLRASPAAAGLSWPEAPSRTDAPAERAGPAVSGPPLDLPLDLDLTVRLLGPIEVFRDEGRKVPASAWKIKRALEVFCYLASSRGHRATKDRIVDALWGAARPAVIERNFHPTISFLRRALNHGHAVPKNFVLFEKGAYLLNPAYRYEIDVERFETTIVSARNKARRGDRGGALAEYAAALPLYRGAFLEEEYEEWAEGPRAHYEELHLAALAEAGDLHVANGELDAGLALLRRLVDREPLNEDASVRLMRTSARAGSRAAIEREFARLSAALEKDLDTPPLPETRRAYQDALNEVTRAHASSTGKSGPAPASPADAAQRGATSRRNPPPRKP